MAIAIAVVSMLAATAFFGLFNRILPIKICPICAGVSATWLWMLAGIIFGVLDAEEWRIITAAAMGGSVVGIAYQAEKRSPQNRSPFLWKTLFIPTGFAAAFGLITRQWILFAAAAVALFLLGFFFLSPLFSRKIKQRQPDGASEKKKEAKIKTLEEKMKNCC